MMDFNLILLLAGLGLLVVVILFALWGFLGGLKRELSCIAVFIVLLVLSWLVFGDSATLLNAKAGQQVAEFLGIQDGSISTVWDAVLVYARAQIPNGEVLLVEGKETYALFYSIASTVCHAIGLLVGTIAVLVICPIIRFITHIIGLIIRAVKKSKAKKNPVVETIEDKEEQKAVVVIPSTEEGEEVVLTKDENLLEKKPAGKRRLWGALAGALKGVFVVIMICAPLSGLSSVINSVTPETQKLLKDVINGDTKVQLSESSNDAIEMIFEFAKEYENSALGKFANGSRFFFGKSFSEQMFDGLFKMETKNQTIYLSDELITFIEAVNALNGNVNFNKINRTEFRTALEALKDSKLMAELMPVGIEYAYEIEDFNKLLVESGETDAFLDLRYNNWKRDIKLVLDAVKEVYDLNLFPFEEFNYLTMNSKELNDVTTLLSRTELMSDALPIGLEIVFSLEAVQKQIGKIDVPDLKDVNIEQEFDLIVSIYDKFKDYGIESLEGFDFNNFLNEVLNDESQTSLLFDIVQKVLDLQLVDKLAIPTVFGYAKTNEQFASLLEDAGETENFMALANKITVDDVSIYVDAIKVALELVDLTNFPSIGVDYFHFDPNLLDEVVLKLFSTSTTNQILPVGIHIALSVDAVKQVMEDALTDVSFEGIDWESEFILVVDIYREFLKLEFESIDDFAGDKIDLLQTILEDEGKYNTTLAILLKLVDAQLYNRAGVPSMQYFLDKLIDEKYQEFSDIIGLEGISVDQWKADLQNILESAKLINELNVLDNLNPFDYTKLDIASDEGVAKIKELINNIFDLNILGNDELKTKLLVASINQFNWAILPEDFQMNSIVWDNEESVLLQLVDIYKSINDLDGFDIFDINNTKWVDLLESDAFLDYVISALESAVDSSVVLELLPGLLDKYLLPRLDDIESVDDETLFSDILSKVPSEELVNEIIKLIDVVKAAVEINLLNAKEGVDAIDFANTDALKTIVSGILDSTLVQGYEGRIIRIILKATNILDIPKDSAVYEQLVSIDYSGEKDVLIKFIDAVESVLKDPNFKLTNEEGKFNLDLVFWAEDQNANTLLNGIKILFGSYPDHEEVGSKLIEALLPSIYDTFVEDKDLIPNEFKDIVEELDVTNASGELLVRDIRRLIFVAEQLIEMDAHTLLNNGDMFISTPEAVNAVNSILDALHDIELIKGHESETLAWGVNYLANELDIKVDEITDEFNDVNWLEQNEVYKEIFADIATLLRNNEILTYNELLEFIENKQYNTSKFITDQNVNDLLDILDQLVDVEVIDAIVPLAVKYGINVLDDKSGIGADYINDFTSEELNHDFHKLIEIAHKLVDDLDIVHYYINQFDGDLPLPNEEVIRALVDDLFELNIIINADGKLATLIYDEIVERVLKDGQKLIVSADDFAFDTIDWTSEKEIIRELISVGYDFLEVNNIQNMASVQQFIKEKLYASPVILRDETGYVLSDAIRVLQNSQLIGNVIEKLYNYGIDFLANSGKVNLPIPIDYLSGMPKDKLMEDFGNVANILDKAVEFGLMEYLADNDIRGLNLELVAQIVEDLYTLNIVRDHGLELLGNIYNYGLKYLEDQTNGTFILTQTQIDQIDCEQEIVALANVVRSLQAVIDASSINSLGDVINFINNKPYNTKEFYEKDVYNAIIDVVNCATNLQLLELITPQLINHAKAFGETKNLDLSFLQTDEYTANLFIDDVRTVLDMVKIGYDFGIIDYVFDRTLYTIEAEVLCNILDLVPSLNIANMYLDELLYQGVKYGLDKTNIDITVTKEDFANISLTTEIPALKDIVRATKELLDEKDIITLNDVKTFFNNKDYNKEAFYDVETGTILEKVVTAAADLETLQVLLPKALNYGVDKVTKYDLSFLKNEFSKEELAADLKAVAQLIVPAINAEMIGLVFGKNLNDLVLHFEIYPEMLDAVQDMNILNKKYAQFVALGVNEGLKAVQIDKSVQASEFEGITFKQELSSLKEVINGIEMLASSKGYHTVGGVRDAINAKVYQTVAFYDTEVGASLEKVLDSAADLETVKVLLPKALNYGVDKITKLDLSFLKNEFSKEELAEDVKVLAKLVTPLIEAELVKVLFKGNLDEITLQYGIYQEMLDVVQNMNILNKKYANFIVMATNYGLDKVNSKQEVTIDMFDNIQFANEVVILKDVISSIANLTDGLNAYTIGSVKDIYNDVIKNKQYKDMKYSNQVVVNNLLSVLDQALNMETLQVLLPTVSIHASEYLFEKGTDIRFLFETVSQEELLEDAKNLVLTLIDLVDYGMVEFVLHDGEIDVANVDAINHAIDKVIHLHILSNNEERTIFVLLDKLGIDTKDITLSDVNWQEEVFTLQNIVNETKDILVMEQANTISKIKAIDFKKFITITDDTNGYIDVFAGVFKALAADQLVERLSLNVSEKYLAKLDPKYNGLLDIHNIYNSGSEFTADLASLADILLEVKKLDIFTFLVQSADYPFSEINVIDNLIHLVFNLNYLNIDSNRLNEVIKAVDPLVKYDLSQIDATGVDLRADADKFIEMYDSLVIVFTHENWPIKNKDDLKNTSVQKEFLLSTTVWENTVDALLKFMDTTVYDKTGAAIGVLALPVVKQIAPTYYDLLALDSVTVEMMANDLELVKGLLEDVSVLDLTHMAKNGEYLTMDVKTVINHSIDVMVDSMILKGHTNSLFEHLMNNYVNGHKIAGVDVPNGTIVAEGIDFVYDRDAYKGLVDEVFAIFANENITTIDQLKTFAKEIRQKSKFIEFTSQDSNWQSIEKIVNYLADMTMVEVNGLSVMNNIVSPKLDGDLAILVDFSQYNKTEFMSDIDALAILITQLNEFGIASVMRNENINYDQVALVKDMLNHIASVNYLKYNLNALIDLVDSKNVLPIKLESLKLNEFDYQGDAIFIGNAYEDLIPFLISSDNTLKTRSDIMNFIRSNFELNDTLKDAVIAHKYAFVNAYDELVQTTMLPLLMNEVANYAKTKLPTKYQDVIDMMKIDELTFVQKQQDVLQSAIIVRSLVDLGLGDVIRHRDYNFEGSVTSTLNNTSVQIEKVDLITDLIDALYPLNILRNRADLVVELLNALDADTTEIDLSHIDWDLELIQVKSIVNNGLRALLDYDIKTVKETKNYVSNFINMTAKDMLKELKDIYHMVNLERVVNVVEAMDYSSAFDQIFKPLYNRYVFNRLPSRLNELGDLTDYSVINLDEDMHYFAIIVRSLFDIKEVPGSIKENAESLECILSAQNAIEAFFSLNYLDQKRQAVVNFVDDWKPSLGLGSLDLTNVDFKADGRVASQYAKDILVILGQTNYLNLEITQLGNTYLMSSVVALYNGLVETSLFDVTSIWAFDTHIEPKFQDIEQFNKLTFTDERVHSIFVEIGETLNAMLDMGFFSNDGVDFTNKDNTDRLFGLLTDVFTPNETTLKYIDKFKANMYEIGYVALSYEGLSTTDELRAIRDSMKSITSFVRNYASQLKDNYSILAEATLQADLTNCIQDLFDSRIIAQLAMPLISGTVKILTKDIVTLNILENVQNDEFISMFLPDVYKVINALDNLGILNKDLNYKDVDAILELVSSVIHGESFKDHLNDITKFAMCFVGINVKDADLSDVNWNDEYTALEMALNEMRDVLKDVVISNKHTYLNNEFLSALANATPYFENSKFLPKVAREVADFVASRYYGNRFDAYINHLFDVNYTDEDLMKDYGFADDILRLVVASDYFGNGISNDNLDPIVDLANILLNLEYAKGMETRIINAGFKRIDLFKDYEVDFNKVTDWSVEKDVFVLALRELAAFSNIVSLNEITPEIMKDEQVQTQFVKVVDAMSKSILGQQLLPQIYAEYIENNLGDEYAGIIDFDDSEFTPDMWASEFEKLFKGYNTLVNNGFGSDNGLTLTLDETIDTMAILFGQRENSEAGIYAIVKNPEVWVKKLLDNNVVDLSNGASLNMSTNRDWLEEAYAIVDVLIAMKNFTDVNQDFDYTFVYKTTDKEQLENLLVATTNCVALRGTVMQVIVNTMTTNVGMQEKLEELNVIDQTFFEEYALYEVDPTYYNASYWTEERISNFAEGIAEANKLLSN